MDIFIILIYLSFDIISIHSSPSSPFDVFSSSTHSNCISCASTRYLDLWDHLLHHYFPPKNFTDLCWNPDYSISTVPCTSPCFTLIETVNNERPGIYRGCVDRFLLFGMDQDIRMQIEEYHRNQRCKQAVRKIYRLYEWPNHEYDATSISNDQVTMCACTGSGCNGGDHSYINISNQYSITIHSFIFFLLLLLLFY